MDKSKRVDGGDIGEKHGEKHGEKQANLNPIISVGEGQVEADVEKYGTLHRTLTTRMIHVISLGSNVGSGLFIATGKALADGGPGNMFLGYLVVCIGVWANLQNLTEMTIAFPTSGNYIDYADRWVDPALAFGAGVAEWLGWTSVFASEATFFVILVNYWAGGTVPDAALLSIFLVICLAVFFMPNRFFGWLEYFGSLVKVFLFIFITLISLAIIGGAGSKGYVRDGSTWTDLPFKNGFGGFANAALLAIWAIGDQVFIGVMGGEAESPRYSMAHSANLIPWRVAVFYLVSTVLVSIIVPSNDPRLLGGSGVAASPFVIAVQDAGIKGVPDLINICMIIGVLAIALECIFLPSRILRTMALQKLLPAFIAKVDERGRPRWALTITALAAVLLTYMSLSVLTKVKGEPLHRRWADLYAYQKEFVYQQVSAAVNALRAVGIVWTDPGPHNVLYHQDDAEPSVSVIDFEYIELRNGEAVVANPEMTAIFGPEAVQQRKYIVKTAALHKILDSP
ncbi:Amino acid/polyamine transporter I [Penicillium freii]|nr:Amino acid/polyamine transporter I [Penicillium freii]